MNKEEIGKIYNEIQRDESRLVEMGKHCKPAKYKKGVSK